MRRIVRGGADDSFGIEVAKLAGIPNKIVARAKQILAELENGSSGGGRSVSVRTAVKEPEEPMQIALVPSQETEILEKLRSLDVNTLTPIECMNTLFELSQLAKQ